jgi:hypothetical protein
MPPVTAEALDVASSPRDKVLSVESFLGAAVGRGFHEEEGAPSKARRLDSPTLKAELYR